MTSQKIKECNTLIFSRLAEYLNNCPDFVSCEMVSETAQSCGFGREEAFRTLISGALGLYDDREMRDGYLRHMFRLLDAAQYESDKYYSEISLKPKTLGNWRIDKVRIKPYEAFVYNDPKVCTDGRILPQIGFFDREFEYPCIYQDSREWMMITPNEIETMRRPISEAFGRVVTYGLGLGYFAFMCSQKTEVSSVTAVECDEKAIRLFESEILPQFTRRDKIKIVRADAFEYAAENSDCDFVFADIWHDPTDGVAAYRRLKELEKPGIRYSYWIEDTLKLYL